MRGLDFKRLARQGVKSYGDDPWFFLRELAQNSRDAGSQRINVTARGDASREVLVFTDDGRGMDRDHAQRFLFRLYASSKESERSSAGMYGIGFWTVLGFEPDRIEVTSRTRGDSWALRMDRNLDLEEAPCDLAKPGTRVTLARPAVCSDPREFHQEVRDALGRYCRYLRRNDRASSPLPVDLDGEEINEPIRTGGPMELRFRDGPVEGAVGLADAPRVALFARGLPVWEGMLLEELSHNPPPVQSNVGLETGLSPVFVLNGNDLRVVMDRNAVVDNKALRRLRRSAAAALRRLVREQLDGLPARGWFPRLRRLLNRVRYRRSGAVFAGVAALALILGAVLSWELLNESSPRPLAPSATETAGEPHGLESPVSQQEWRGILGLQDALSAYHGATSDDAPGRDLLDLTWTPRTRAWFRLAAVEDYIPWRGFVRTPPPGAPGLPPGPACREDCLRVRVPIRRGGPLSLPLPTGWSLVPGSAIVSDHVDPLTASLDGYGDPLLEIPTGGGVLTYSCAPVSETPGLRPADRTRLLDLGDAGLPEALDEALAALEPLPPGDRVSHAISLVRPLVRYVEGRGPDPSHPGGPTWARRAMDLGVGDCDVINGLLVLALRRVGIPARLAIGFIGEQGQLRPGLHAWTEFHLGGWQAVDGSAPVGALEAPPTNEIGAEEILPPARSEDPRSARTMPPYPRPVLVGSSPALKPVALKRRIPAATPTPRPLPAVAAQEDTGDAVLGTSLVAALAAALLLLIHLLLRRRQRSWRHLEGSRAPEDMDQVLGRMALAWSVRPELWGMAGFSLAPLLPRLRGGRISLERALHLANRGRLFHAQPDNPLAASPRRGAMILDSSNQGFATFIRRIPGAVDLDRIHDAAPRDPALLDGPVPTLLAAVNQLLEHLGEASARCLLAKDLATGGLRDVDLSRLRVPGDDLPTRFIAADPDAPTLRSAAAVHGMQPALAIYLALEWISRRSGLPRRSPEQLRRAAARLLLEEAP